MKILNLYAGIGGNRKKWSSNHDITAVEMNTEIAKIYQDLYPKDKVIVADAHAYLQEHFHEYEFIWSSPPCQSHASLRQNLAVRFRNTKPIYPDLKLYEEIIFLQYNFKGNWIIENVHPYYRPLIPPAIELDRHYFWSNMFIFSIDFERPKIRAAQIPELEKKLGISLSDYQISNKRQILRNCVLPEVGQYLLEYAETYIRPE